MNRKSILFPVGCFIFGLLLGSGVSYVASTLYYGKVAARGLLAVENIRLIQAGQRATRVHWKESPAVGVYELTQSLDTLKQAEKIPDNPTIRRDSTYLNITLTHGRLAKLYAQIGQTNLSTQHIAEAIECSKRTAHLVITNEAGVSNYVALWDRAIVRMSSP